MDLFVSAGSASDASSSVVAWAEINGEKVTGSLDELLKANCDTIYIVTGKTIILDGDVTALSGKTLKPDPEQYPEGYFVVSVSNTSNSIELTDALFVRVASRVNLREEEASLTVEAQNYLSGQWQSAVPMFRLSSQPDFPADMGAYGYSYAVSVDGGVPVRLGESDYAAVEEGSYTLQFIVADPDTQALAQSDTYTVRLDATAPLLQVSAGKDGSLMVVAGDLGSGAVSCSLDGGATWQMLTDQGEGVASFVQTLTVSAEFAPGMIIVQDRAGNKTSNGEKVSVAIRTAGAGFGSYRGGSSRSVSHSSSSEDSVTDYNAVELILDDGSMSRLTVGDETLDMLLVRDEGVKGDREPSFTASFMVWNGKAGEIGAHV